MSSPENEGGEGFEPDTNPVPESAIESLPSVTITDPSFLCAICTDHFGSTIEPESDNSVSLPCGHVYHSGCIVPWLRRRNSCPLCRCPLHCRRRLQGPRDDMAVADRAADVARALSELSSRAGETVASAQAILAAMTVMVQEERARRATS